jgi:lysophospholipase L1-like esterase
VKSKNDTEGAAPSETNNTGEAVAN